MEKTKPKKKLPELVWKKVFRVKTWSADIITGMGLEIVCNDGWGYVSQKFFFIDDKSEDKVPTLVEGKEICLTLVDANNRAEREKKEYVDYLKKEIKRNQETLLKLQKGENVD